MTARIVIVLLCVLVFSATTTSPKLNTALSTTPTLVSKLPDMLSTTSSNLNSSTLLSTILLTPTETVVSENYSTKPGFQQENTSVSTYPHSNVITTTHGSMSKSNESTVNKTEVTKATLMPEYNSSHPTELHFTDMIHNLSTVSKLYSLFTTRTYNPTSPVTTSGTQTHSLVNYTSAKATFVSTSNASSRTSSGLHQTFDTNTPLPVTIYSNTPEHGHSTITSGTSTSAGPRLSTDSPSPSPSMVGVTTPLTEGT